MSASRRPRVRPLTPLRGADPRPLRPQDVSALRVGTWRHLDHNAILRTLERYPNRSLWLPHSLEYLVLAPWRHRPEIAVVQELAAAGGAPALLAGAVERCRRAGDRLLLAIEMDETRPPSFYERAGLSLVEEIVTYELDLGPPRPLADGPDFTFRPVTVADEAGFAALLDIDHASFPWLWWNCADEFRAYGATPGVHLLLGEYQAQPIAYLGFTAYPGWGHLDRIAVLPEFQGRGFGRAATAFAVEAMAQAGARRVALSTQKENVRSQLLYQRFGFHRSPAFDYRLYGVALDDGAELPAEPIADPDDNAAPARLENA
jgi:ribosomal protein S18 acetylase RimI-like enzyme